MEDDVFGWLQWDTEFEEWNGCTAILPYGEVTVGLPADYPDDPEHRKHIQETMAIIKRDELRFRKRAAHDLFTGGGYVLFWDENQLFDHRQFVNEMYLANITFDTDFPDTSLSLYYEYGEEGMEHAIVIHLTWDGAYSEGRVM